jgi:hypothetical protein
MRGKPTKPLSAPHTKAWLTFEQNLDSVHHMVLLGGRELRLLGAEARRLSTHLEKHDLTKKANVANVTKAVQRFSKATEARVERYGTTKVWQVVMLVTCVEAYLHDLLCIAASVDPELMNKSQQLAPYADVIAATSLAELAGDLRARWARGWLSDGGPTRWISRLERMGARGYPDGLAPRLELIWGIRHIVVHGAGVTTKDFVKRHPGVVTAAGDRLGTKNVDFGSSLEAVKGFMEPTENFFLARYPSMLTVGGQLIGDTDSLEG